MVPNQYIGTLGVLICFALGVASLLYLVGHYQEWGHRATDVYKIIFLSIAIGMCFGGAFYCIYQCEKIEDAKTQSRPV